MNVVNSGIKKINMVPVVLKPLLHRGEEQIGIYFENYGTINNLLRKKAGAKWSQSNKCWYLPLSKESYNKLFVVLKGKAEIEQSALHKYLADKKLPSTKHITSSVNPAVQTSIKHSTIIQNKPVKKQPSLA